MPIPGIIASSQTASTLSSFYSIATATGTGSSATITFSSIPSGYKALQIRYIAKTTDTVGNNSYSFQMRFNGDTGNNYAYHTLVGSNTAVTASGIGLDAWISSNDRAIPNSGTNATSVHGVGIMDILDYTSTTKNKTLRAVYGIDGNGISQYDINILESGLWYPSTIAAITSISILANPSAGNWTTTSQFALYGVK